MQAIALEEAETKIRQVTKDEYFKQTPKAAIDRKVAAIVREAEKQIKIPALAEAARRSLLRFYDSQYRELRRSFGWQLATLSAIFLLQGRTLSGREIKPTAAQKAQAVQTLMRHGYTPPRAADAPTGEDRTESRAPRAETPQANGAGSGTDGTFTDGGDVYEGSRLLGSPMKKYMQSYMRDNVKPALDRLVGQQARDPDDVTGRNTLRNRAEMEVRYQDHLDQIGNFKAGGVKLVIASAHADCSDRCRPWQGRVYSLDGTRGTTDDGRAYVPLEEATDVFYTTKAGKTYKNGLLGFNCRHYLVEYKKGYRFPKPNAEAERREYAITIEQRRLEREVRKWRTVAVESKDIDRERYSEAKKRATAANNAYIAFSKQHDRAYYPSRTKLI